MQPSVFQPGKKVLVRLQSRVDPEDAFEPRVEQSGTTLRLDEKCRGHSSRGHVEWTILVPSEDQDLRLEIETASGNLDVRGILARIRLDTASGDVELTDVRLASGSNLSTASGNYDLTGVTLGDNSEISTASGDITVVNSQGSMELSTASGDVTVESSEIAGRCKFTTASGNLDLHLAKLTQTERYAASASGDVGLNVDEFGDNFTMLLIKRADRGRIVCPFEFTSQRTFEDRDVYEEKVVQRGRGGPEITLRTASGSVVVRKWSDSGRVKRGLVPRCGPAFD